MKAYAEIKCKQCGVPFTPKVTRAKFCCDHCRHTWMNHHRQLYSGTCDGCGAAFVGVKRRRYCTAACSVRHNVPQKVLVCEDCHRPFTFTGRTRAHRCVVCRKKYGSIRQMQWRVSRDPTIKIGAGSGGAQWGKDNHEWKPEEDHKSTKYHGSYRIRCAKNWDIPVCAACGATGLIHVHHIDGNPDNVKPGNLIPLCVPCHLGKIHRKKWKTELEFIRETMAILPEECRSKIAELSGEAETPIRTEEYAKAHTQGQSIEGQIIPPRGRETL